MLSKKVQPDKCSIIIPCCNQLKFTKLCIDSIEKHTKYSNYEIIIIDNGSKDETSVWLNTHQNFKLIKNSSNLGAPKAFNQGIEASSGEFIILLNNDTVVTDGWLSKLVKCATSEQQIGIVGASSNSREAESLNLTEIQRVGALLELKNAGNYKKTAGVTSFCMLIKRHVIEDIGLFDENYSLGTNDDHDFCLRASLAGYEIVCALDTFVYHHYSKTLQNFSMPELDKKNREYFVKKFGRHAVEYLKQINQPYGTRSENPEYKK